MNPCSAWIFFFFFSHKNLKRCLLCSPLRKLKNLSTLARICRWDSITKLWFSGTMGLVRNEGLGLLSYLCVFFRQLLFGYLTCYLENTCLQHLIQCHFTLRMLGHNGSCKLCCVKWPSTFDKPLSLCSMNKPVSQSQNGHVWALRVKGMFSVWAGECENRKRMETLGLLL